jgi:hypothetical protein
MSGYRDYGNPNSPLYRTPYRNMGDAPAARDGAWGWIVGAVCMVIVLVIAFGMGREPSRLASNDFAPPTIANSAAPAAPGLVPPPALAPTPAFAPSRP